MKNLVLFDIDHTLLTTNGISRNVWASILGDKVKDFDVAGKTDYWIIRQCGITSPVEIHEITMIYERLLARTLLDSIPIVPLPGVVATLRWLMDETVSRLGVQTGNLHYPAKMKLVSAGLRHWLHGFGGYAEDAEFYAEGDESGNKYGAIRYAISQTMNEYPTGFKTFVIGDSIGDIAAGLSNEAITIGVATGKTTEKELREANAHHVAKDMFGVLKILDNLI